MAKHFCDFCSVSLLRGSTITKITPMRQALTCGRVLAQGPPRVQVLQNSGSLMFMSRVKTLSARDCFFACRIVLLGLLILNIKVRHNIPEFLN